MKKIVLFAALVETRLGIGDCTLTPELRLIVTMFILAFRQMESLIATLQTNSMLILKNIQAIPQVP